MQISKIYCAVHLNWDFLYRLGEGMNRMQVPLYRGSQKTLDEASNQQTKLIVEAIKEPSALLIVLPSLLGYESEYYEYLDEYEREVLDMELQHVAHLAQIMGERLVLVDHTKLRPHQKELTLVQRWLRKDSSLAEDLQYIKSKIDIELGRNTEFITFGEYTDQCVKMYGEYIAELLGLGHNFRINYEASVCSEDLIRIR